MSDEEWCTVMDSRKVEAERLMLIEDHKKGFVTLKEIRAASKYWGCSEHEAELRLMNGELPDE